MTLLKMKYIFLKETFSLKYMGPSGRGGKHMAWPHCEVRTACCISGCECGVQNQRADRRGGSRHLGWHTCDVPPMGPALPNPGLGVSSR